MDRSASKLHTFVEPFLRSVVFSSQRCRYIVGQTTGRNETSLKPLLVHGDGIGIRFQCMNLNVDFGRLLESVMMANYRFVFYRHTSAASFVVGCSSTNRDRLSRYGRGEISHVARLREGCR